jgi:hypothetical protein
VKAAASRRDSVEISHDTERKENEVKEKQMNSHDRNQRTVLPIPDQPHVGLTTYDAKDPETKYDGGELNVEVSWVEIDIGKDAVNLDHLLSPEQRYYVAVATQ